MKEISDKFRFGYFFLTNFFHMIYNHFEKGLQKSGLDKIFLFFAKILL